MDNGTILYPIINIVLSLNQAKPLAMLFTGQNPFVIGLILLAVVLLAGALVAVEAQRRQIKNLRRDLERRQDELSILNRISRTLRSTLEMDTLLEEINHQVATLLNVDNFYVALYDPENEQISYPLAVKHGQRQEWPRRKLLNRLTDKVILEEKPILLGHHAAEELAQTGMPTGEDPPFAWMGVPLITSQGTMGCLALFSLTEEIRFTQEDINLLAILSGQTSVAIENARLYENVQQRAIQLESLVHDLRSPVSAIVSALDVIEEEAPFTEDDELSIQALRIAHRSALRVLGMVESLLDIAKFQSNTMNLELSSIDIKSLITTAMEDYVMQANEFGIYLKIDVPSNLPQVIADKEKIKRVISNLVDNAIKYTPAGGTVVVSAQAGEHERLQIQVRDSGPGIPEQYHQKIFNRFEQIPGQGGRRRGYGLGLAYCRLAVEAHGGKIWVDSGREGGSIFSFTLPVSYPENETR